MATMSISLPDSLEDFVDGQVKQRGYSASSDYVCELIRKDQDRLQLRGLLLTGAIFSKQSWPMMPTRRSDLLASVIDLKGLQRRYRFTPSLSAIKLLRAAIVSWQRR